MEIPRLLLVVCALVATILVIMSALSSNWYSMYDRIEYGDGEVDEEYYLYGLFFMDEIYMWEWEGESDTGRDRYYYSEDWYWEEDETYPQVGRATGYLVWSAAACAIAFLILTIFSLFFFLDRLDRRIKVATGLLAIASMLLLVVALSYFATQFPPAIGWVMDEWEWDFDEEGLGPAYFMALFACALLGIGAFFTTRGLGNASTLGLPPPPKSVDPRPPE